MPKDYKAMDWDDEISLDTPEPQLILPEGDYTFTVAELQRDEATLKNGNSCPRANVFLDVDHGLKPVRVKISFLLLHSLEWQLSAFFRCLGLKKPGEKARMRWTDTPGKRGKAHFRPREYTVNGETRQANDISQYYDWDPIECAIIVDQDHDVPW